ncbi:efflux RND transporter periplasmic adaptor subunit [Arenimonas sp.]|uniref:efflux RND transporter periplasmic adaptor subunit n=1 Tax=Arenimonas sp. TaxID=1872635 RepID=UPI0025C1B71B|nr:efflux RND transporter periplasmic adaptor subunit [Arenimonas sp.]
MNRFNWSVLALAVGAALALGWWSGRASAPDAGSLNVQETSAESGERKILYYRNPMGLPDTSPVPKKDAMGMDYIPVFEGGEPAAEPGTVVLPPDKVQKLGVRTEVAVREALVANVRASASVQVDETRQFVVAPRFEGWIETLYANETGMTVRRGEPLMAIYSPELIAAQGEYAVADAAAKRLADSDPASAATMRQLRDAAQTRLRNWEVAGAHVARQGREARLVLSAPADAVVVDKPVVQGDRFTPGQTILRLADLSTVWVIAEVPTSASADLAIGSQASFETPSLPGQRFEGEVSFLQPVVNLTSRTVGVRIELPNPDGVLRPGLFGDVELQGRGGDPTVVVPRSSVIDSGTRQLVLVETAPGRFAPREVRLGARAGDRVAVLSGVEAGEKVVVSANFLIDAESNLRSAMQGMEHGSPPPAEDHSAHEATAAPPAEDPHAAHTGGQ